MKKIEIGHGSGGRLSRELIKKVFLKYLKSDELSPLEDASYVRLNGPDIAVTTDSYVIRPLFFPGGDIGKLSVCGTVNDLIVSGSEPAYLSIGLILEEGFPLERLEDIFRSISTAAQEASVKIVTGDTKVVERDKCDGLYINTTGVGTVVRPLPTARIADGDQVIVTGTLGDHGTAIALARDSFDIEASVVSDCASLHELLMPLLSIDGLRWMRDPTRGGAATALSELSSGTGLGIEIHEENIPVREDVRFISHMLGYDPLYLANEGKAVIITSRETAKDVLATIRKHPLGSEAAIIGEVSAGFRGLRLRTGIGGVRALDLLDEEMLPRIC